MDLNKFLYQVIDGLLKKLGDGYSVREHTINGINGIVNNALIIEQAGINIHPCIYVDDCYEDYISGEADMDEIISRIYKSYQENAFEGNIDIAGFTNWNVVKPNIRCKLINTERNTDYLQSVPHRKYLDLSIVYYVFIPEFSSAGNATVQIRNKHMALWNVCEDILYDTAWENMQDSDNVAFSSMSDILEQLIGMKKPMEKQLSLPMYVLSNKEKWNGAVQMCNTNILNEIGNFFENDFWILPSSTHEVLIVPVDCVEDSSMVLAQMVEDVNDSQLAPNEILSYHVYRYRRDTRQLEIAA